MRSFLSWTRLFSLFLPACTGCGTLVNVTAPPGPPLTTYRAFGPTTCERMGGVERSMAFADLFLAPPYTPLGLGILVADVPLSFVGDLATLPLVAAINRNGESTRRETRLQPMTNDVPPYASWVSPAKLPDQSEPLVQER